MDTPNMNYLDQLAGDDREFRLRFIHILQTEFPAERSEYEEAIERYDWKQAKELVHKIKHKISILGLKRAYDIAGRYEEDLMVKNTKYQTAFEGILNKMEAYIKQLKP
jgi:HPt (histidine-containing phosphotransfer) domain-containing protein